MSFTASSKIVCRWSAKVDCYELFIRDSAQLQQRSAKIVSDKPRNCFAANLQEPSKERFNRRWHGGLGERAAGEESCN